MAVTTERGTVLLGDWRSGHHGADRRAHLWVYRLDHYEPACLARLRRDTTSAVRTRKLAELCYDCLSAAAAGRA